MCDGDSFDDMAAYLVRGEVLSRRDFGAMSVGASLASVLAACKPAGSAGASATRAPPPRLSESESAAARAPSTDAAAMTEAEVSVATPDGACDAYFVHPAGRPSPGVLVWPDIFGLRPAFREMGKRLAASGHAVLVVNPFYRTKKAPTSAPHADFSDPATREALMALARSLTPETAATDSRAFTAWLDGAKAVDTRRKLGTIGYCMGGPLVFRTAALQPDRVGAAASFHGGGLVTSKPDSPHLLIPKMKAQLLVAIASNDDAKDPEAKNTLKAAFAQAALLATIEVFDGALHGWCPPDSQVYDKAAAEKAWGELLALFARALA